MNRQLVILLAVLALVLGACGLRRAFEQAVGRAASEYFAYRALNVVVGRPGSAASVIPLVTLSADRYQFRGQRLIEVSMPCAPEEGAFGARIELPIPEFRPIPLFSFGDGWIRIL